MVESARCLPRLHRERSSSGLRQKAKAAHPDAYGTNEAFQELGAALEQALATSENESQ